MRGPRSTNCFPSEISTTPPSNPRSNEYVWTNDSSASTASAGISMGSDRIHESPLTVDPPACHECVPLAALSSTTSHVAPRFVVWNVQRLGPSTSSSKTVRSSSVPARTSSGVTRSATCATKPSDAPHGTAASARTRKPRSSVIDSPGAKAGTASNGSRTSTLASVLRSSVAGPEVAFPAFETVSRTTPSPPGSIVSAMPLRRGKRSGPHLRVGSDESEILIARLKIPGDAVVLERGGAHANTQRSATGGQPHGLDVVAGIRNAARNGDVASEVIAVKELDRSS